MSESLLVEILRPFVSRLLWYDQSSPTGPDKRI